MIREIWTSIFSIWLIYESIINNKLWAYLLVGFIISIPFTINAFKQFKNYLGGEFKFIDKKNVVFAVLFLWLLILTTWPQAVILHFLPEEGN